MTTAFGPLVVVAAGGTMVELLADRVVACPPVSHAGALRLLDGLRIRPLLAGWRGAPAVDIDALAGVIVGFSNSRSNWAMCSTRWRPIR